MIKYIITLILSGVLSLSQTTLSQQPIITEDTRPRPQVYEVQFNQEPTEYELGVLQYLHNKLSRDEMTAKDKAKLLDLKEKYGDEKVNEILDGITKETEEYYEQESKKEAEEVEKKAKEEEENVLADLISYSCDTSLNSSLIETISKAPKSILDSVINSGYHIELVPDPGEGYGFKYICGLTITEERKIRIQSRESKFRKAVIHEMSHVFDESLGWISNTEEFKKIFNSEVSSFKVHDYRSNHYKDNVQEYFAEACQEYVYHPAELKKNTPKTYEFIKNLV